MLILGKDLMRTSFWSIALFLWVFGFHAIAGPADPDCNQNGYADADDIGGVYSRDCNRNGVPDECELTDNDCDGNGVPDECDLAGRVVGLTPRGLVEIDRTTGRARAITGLGTNILLPGKKDAAIDPGTDTLYIRQNGSEIIAFDLVGQRVRSTDVGQLPRGCDDSTDWLAWNSTTNRLLTACERHVFSIDPGTGATEVLFEVRAAGGTGTYDDFRDRVMTNKNGTLHLLQLDTGDFIDTRVALGTVPIARDNAGGQLYGLSSTDVRLLVPLGTPIPVDGEEPFSAAAYWPGVGMVGVGPTGITVIDLALGRRADEMLLTAEDATFRGFAWDSAAQAFYVVDRYRETMLPDGSDGEGILRVPLATGIGARIGSVPKNIRWLTVDEAGGKLYGLRDQSSILKLLEIDLTTFAYRAVEIDRDCQSLAWDSNRSRIVSACGDELRSIDLNTGVTTFLAEISIQTIRGIAFDSAADRFVVLEDTGAQEVDASSLAVADLPPPGDRAILLTPMYDPANDRFLTFSDDWYELVEWNPDTGDLKMALRSIHPRFVRERSVAFDAALQRLYFRTTAGSHRSHHWLRLGDLSIEQPASFMSNSFSIPHVSIDPNRRELLEESSGYLSAFDLADWSRSFVEGVVARDAALAVSRRRDTLFSTGAVSPDSFSLARTPLGTSATEEGTATANSVLGRGGFTFDDSIDRIVNVRLFTGNASDPLGYGVVELIDPDTGDVESLGPPHRRDILGAEFAGGDCNENGIVDACEPDLNGTGLPEDCDVTGDWTGDTYVTSSDHAQWGTCATAPCAAKPCKVSAYPTALCAVFDDDHDGDVDLRDWRRVQQYFREE